MKEVLKYSHCFVCGDKNPCGLKARFYYDGQQAVTRLTADEIFEGYHGIYHGGILSTLLDEVMIKAILAETKYAVTVEMTVRFLHPVRIGDELVITGTIIRQKGRVFFTEGQVADESGKIYATATGKYIEAGEGLKEELMNSLDS